MKVFIADDSDQIRSSIKDVLHDIAGVEVVGEASNAENLTETIGRLRPQVVILDIRMPGGSGIGALKKIKAQYPSTVVIMFSDYSYKLYREKSMELGADFFFEKSIEFEKIETVLKKLTYDSSISQTER
jgi:DNA-binding NarL/FixJ family response regulator